LTIAKAWQLSLHYLQHQDNGVEAHSRPFDPFQYPQS
jgi:hypothetical protein